MTEPVEDTYPAGAIIEGQGGHDKHRVLVIKVTPLDDKNTWVRLRCLTCNHRNGWGFYYPGESPWVQ